MAGNGEGVASATLAFAIVLLAYFLFYTGYSKQSKSLSVRSMLDVILISRGINHTVVEINKIVALAGLTCGYSIRTAPSWDHRTAYPSVSAALTSRIYDGTLVPRGVCTVRSNLRFQAHSACINVVPLVSLISFLPNRKLESAALRVYALINWNNWADSYYKLVLGIRTGWNRCTRRRLLWPRPLCAMEVDFKGILQVRPFAYLAVALPALAVIASMLIML